MALAPAESRLRPSPDVCFYTLEDGGVLFCDSVQELHGFNTAAAYIWCCLEEGLDAREAASAFARVAALPQADAYGSRGGSRPAVDRTRLAHVFNG